MMPLLLESDPAVEKVQFHSHSFVVTLADGRTLSVPLQWYPRLVHGSEAERQNWQILGDGYAIEWPDLDEHIGVEGLLAGRKSGESAESFRRWRAQRSAQSQD